MSVRRERVDPVRTPAAQLLVHRRWLLPDDLGRDIPLQRLSRLWRGLQELGVTSPSDEVAVDRLWLPPAAPVGREDLPAVASAGALLAGGGAATLLTQMVWLDQDARRDPYAPPDGGEDVGGYRDYTLYAVAHDGFLLMPIPATALTCGACGTASDPGGTRFGEALLVDLARPCPSCGAVLDPERDKALLRNGSTYLLAEACARAALSIELPRAPEAEELPDAQLAAALREAFGAYDELADDQVPAAQ